MRTSRKRHSIPIRHVLIASALLFAGLSTSSDAAGAFDGPDPFVIPAVAFNLDGFSGTDYYFLFSGGYLYQTGTATACFSAPLYLPQGTRLASIKVSAYDTNASANFTVSLRRSRLTTIDSEVMASASTAGSAGFQVVANHSVSFETVDNRNYSYRLETCLAGNSGSSLRLYAVTIGAVLFDDDFESGDTTGWSSTVQ